MASASCAMVPAQRMGAGFSSLPICSLVSGGRCANERVCRGAKKRRPSTWATPGRPAELGVVVSSGVVVVAILALHTASSGSVCLIFLAAEDATLREVHS